MNRHRTSTTRFRVWVTILAMVSWMLPLVIAHGGEEHVTGTVTQVLDQSVTVKTTAGKMVEVAFDAKTTYARDKRPISKSEIKAGDRIVIHAAEVNQKLVAHTIEIGTAPAGKQTAKH